MESDKKLMHETTFGIIPVLKKDGNNYFLVIKSRQGNWGFPKGHPKGDEAPVATARRELEEETNLTDVSILPHTFSESRVHVDPEFTVAKIIIWFIGIVRGNGEVNINDTDEIVEYKWLRFDDAHELLTHDETKRVLLDARIYLSKYEEMEAVGAI
jgi:bis(5'-nucleosidyl)-tetraphosphatase